MQPGKLFKLLTAIGETVLAIPLLGGTLIIGLLWTPLWLMLVLHIVALVLSNQEKRPVAGNILGIVTSVLGWIPFVGMILHIITAIILWTEFGKKK